MSFFDYGSSKYKVSLDELKDEYANLPWGQTKRDMEPNLTATRSRTYKEFDKNKAFQAPQVGDINTPVTTSRFLPTGYRGATIDQSGHQRQMGRLTNAQTNASVARRQQMQDLGLLRSAATGEQPSVAEQQLKAGAEQAIAAQAAAAASARGGAGAQTAAQRQAAFQAANTLAQTNQQAAILRADEMARARGELVAGGQAIRAGDLDQQNIQINAAQAALQPELAQAQLAQQAGLQTQALDVQTGMQGVDLGARAGLQAQQLNQQTNLANLDAQLKAKGLQDQYSLGLIGTLHDLEKTEQQAKRDFYNLDAMYDLAELDAAMEAHRINAGVSQFDAGQRVGMFDRAASALTGGISGLMSVF